MAAEVIGATHLARFIGCVIGSERQASRQWKNLAAALIYDRIDLDSAARDLVETSSSVSNCL